MRRTMQRAGAVLIMGILFLACGAIVTHAVPPLERGTVSAAPDDSRNGCQSDSVEPAATAAAQSTGVGGDVDCDGGPVDCDDWSALQLYWFDRFIYDQAYPDCDISWWCDFNRDGFCNSFDVDWQYILYTEIDDDDDGVVNGDDCCPGTPAGTLVDYRGCVRGDPNCDGVINTLDIDPFVTALMRPTEYYAEYPDCERSNSDVNCDGQVNTFDIDPFVLCLTSGCPPCP
jgi:hypothetical protein